MAIQAPVLFWRNSSETFILAGLGANSDFDLSFGALWFQASRAVVARERHISAQGKPGLLVDETSEIQLFPSSKKKKKRHGITHIHLSEQRESEREWETMPVREDKGAGKIHLFQRETGSHVSVHAWIMKEAVIWVTASIFQPIFQVFPTYYSFLYFCLFGFHGSLSTRSRRTPVGINVRQKLTPRVFLHGQSAAFRSTTFGCYR